MQQLVVVVVAYHVVAEDDKAQPGQHQATHGYRAAFIMMQASLFPVTVWTEYGRRLGLDHAGHIQIAGELQAGQGLHADLGDYAALIGSVSPDPGLQLERFELRQHTGGQPDLFEGEILAPPPVFQTVRRQGLPGIVVVLDVKQTLVGE